MMPINNENENMYYDDDFTNEYDRQTSWDQNDAIKLYSNYNYD